MTYNVFGGTLSLTQSINQMGLLQKSVGVRARVTVRQFTHCTPHSTFILYHTHSTAQTASGQLAVHAKRLPYRPPSQTCNRLTVADTTYSEQHFSPINQSSTAVVLMQLIRLVGCVAQLAERWSSAGELTLSCARPAASG